MSSWIGEDLFDDIDDDSVERTAPEPVDGTENGEVEEDVSVDVVDAAELDFPQERDSAESRSLMPPGEYRFLPVVGYMSGNVAAETDDNEPLLVGDYYQTWWEEESIMPQYPYLLINPVGMSTLSGDDYNYADALRLEKGEQYVLCDSGGYQMSTRDEGEIVDSPDKHNFAKVKLYPEKIVDWQVRNADAGLILDVPPNLVEEGVKIPSNKKLTYDAWVEDVFEPHMEESAQNARRMSVRLQELRDEDVPGADDFYQLGVIHGGTARGDDMFALLRRYHHRMQDAMIDYDGWALSPQPPNSLGQMALHMAYAANECQDVDYIHVLQGGGNTQRALLVYFAMLTDFFVTSDSSTHIRGSQWRQFYLPGSWGKDVIKITNRDEMKLDRFPCACSVCQIAEKELGIEWVTEGKGGERGEVMCMHNVYQTQTTAKAIAALIHKYGPDVIDGLQVTKNKVKVLEHDIGYEDDDTEPNQFWNMMTSRYSERHVRNLWTSMRFLRSAVDKGLDGAMQEGWYIPWSSQRTGEELQLSREGDGMQAQW